MANIAITQPQPAVATSHGVASSPTLYERRHAAPVGPVELFPNPDFAFPAGPSDHPSPDMMKTGHSSLPPRLSVQQSQAQAHGRSGPTRKSASALPQFSFNPSGVPGNTNSPPQSPPLPSPTQNSRQSAGHRRGGSEFIGGDSRSSAPSLTNTSPTKDAFLPPPSSLGPPKGRRGHAHRRSAAMSSHDLSSILQVPSAAKAESAPVTPVDRNNPPSPSLEKPISLSSPPSATKDLSADDLPSPSASESSRPSSSRARVGFSDKVEYIRPLSTISSETESTMSTVRGGHSVSNSISSIISVGTASPTPRFPTPIATEFDESSRPSTAGAVLDAFKGNSYEVADSFSASKRPVSSCSSPRSPDSPKRTSTSDRPEVDVKKMKAGKPEKKPRKVKSWANSIMSRKPKSQDKSNFAPRPPTPPAPREQSVSAPATSNPSENEFFANFDIDDTVTIVSDGATTPQERPSFANWTPRQLVRQDSDGLSPEIDLDAALGPLNNRGMPSSRIHGRGFSEARRKMHSSGFGFGGAFGSSIPSHRRSESAPELIPFDYSTDAKTNAGLMADVFEEDEEEAEREFANSGAVSITSIPEEPAQEQAAEDDHIESQIGIQVVEVDDAMTGFEMRWNFDSGLKVNHDRGLSNITEERSIISREQTPTPTPVPVVTKEPATPPKSDSVDIVEDYEEPRTTRQAPPAPPTSQKETNRPLRISLPLPHQSLMTPDSTTSSFPSPDFPRSQSSLDTPRLGTAASSITESRPYHSVASFGEPGPDMRISVDDVPSLTSSRSTMTSALHNTFPALRPRAAGERTSSLSSVRSAESVQRRKRSSIASLSKLMGNSFGEKSKLHIEQRPQSEHMNESPAEKKKRKKSKRLSKMMQFWKHRESKASLKS